MTQFKNHSVSKRFNALITADSGGGKTSLLASLANAGHKLRIIDADNGLDVLASLLTPEGVANTSFITLKDTPNGKSGWGMFLDIVNKGWKDEHEDLGKIKDWDDGTFLVIDTLNMLGKYAVNAVLANKGKPLDSNPSQPDWGDANRMVESRISYLTSPLIKCSVIGTSHIYSEYQENEAGDAILVGRYPKVVAKSLSKDINIYFNTILRIDIKPQPKGEKRVLRTISDKYMTLKTPGYGLFKDEEEFDLAKMIKKIQENATK